MKRTALNVFWLPLCSLIILTLPALADSQVRIVRLSYLNGPVQIDRNSGQGFERAIMNMPVTQGTRLKTDSGAQAEVEFENGSSVRLTPDSEISFDALSLLDSGTKMSSMKLDRGIAYFNLDHKDDNTFRLQIGGENLEIKKSAHFRVNSGQGQVRLAVLGGEVTVVGPTKTVTVHKKETFTFDTTDQTQYALAKGVDQNQFDSWDKQRGQYQDQYARLAYAKGAPYYGWDDLNYYGMFAFYPGYGYLWRPYGLGAGWDPFGLGSWVFYPGWGYTWVSPYAWGWMPYRYGDWTYVPGHGWGWRPGSWRGWNPVPPVHNPPPRWNPPKPPAPGSGVVSIGQPHPVPTSPVLRSFRDDGNDNGRGHRVKLQPLATPNVAPPGTPANTVFTRPDRTAAGTPFGSRNPRIGMRGGMEDDGPRQGAHVSNPPRGTAPSTAPSGGRATAPSSGGASMGGGGRSGGPTGGGASMGGAGRSGGFGGAPTGGGAATGGGASAGGSGGGHSAPTGGGGRSPRQ